MSTLDDKKPKTTHNMTSQTSHAHISWPGLGGKDLSECSLCGRDYTPS